MPLASIKLRLFLFRENEKLITLTAVLESLCILFCIESNQISFSLTESVSVGALSISAGSKLSFSLWHLTLLLTEQRNAWKLTPSERERGTFLSLFSSQSEYNIVSSENKLPRVCLRSHTSFRKQQNRSPPKCRHCCCVCACRSLGARNSDIIFRGARHGFK